jgi:hypothetical protein
MASGLAYKYNNKPSARVTNRTSTSDHRDISGPVTAHFASELFVLVQMLFPKLSIEVYSSKLAFENLEIS